MNSKKALIVSVAAAAMAAAAPLASLAAPAKPTAAAAVPLFAPPPGAPTSFADIVERVGPAVVSIEVKTSVPMRYPTLPGLPNLQGRQGQPPPTVDAQAAGSGFFISADGYIVTNNHVVENAREITVKLQDQRELPARVIGRDEATDLAVIKVDGRNFPFVSFENAGKPRVGDWVMAVGNPFGLGGTATAGIVSAYGRDIGSTFVDYLQIDAAINRGNSGGPTFDAYGRVIGVNTIIISPSGGSVGIGFAIPAEVAERVTRDLISGGRIRRGYIGASIQSLSTEAAESLGMAGRKGALVAEVTPGGPAEQAGLQGGDVVTAINGRPVENASQLTRQVAMSPVGQSLRLDVSRNGSPRTITVRAGERPSESELAGGAAPADRTVAPDARLGLGVRAISESDRRALNLPASLRGVVVDSVESGSDAARRGLRQGDVIVRVNDQAIASPADLAAAVEAARSSGRPSVLLFVRRQNGTTAVPVQISAEPRDRRG